MEQKKIRISCMGDSITFGLLATSAENSYPSVLQRLLGEEYVVGNYGRSGATVINDFDVVEGRYSPYTKTNEYSLAMKSEPDIVVLMLGMNDGNPTHHFNTENGGGISDFYLDMYRNVLTDMIESLQKLDSSPQIYLVKTTQMRRKVSEGFEPDYVKYFLENLEIIRKIQVEVAQEKNIHIIDTYNDMQKDSYYNDGCHLTDEGYYKLGETIWKHLKK
jgi:sialate O-acetylesterase